MDFSIPDKFQFICETSLKTHVVELPKQFEYLLKPVTQTRIFRQKASWFDKGKWCQNNIGDY